LQIGYYSGTITGIIHRKKWSQETRWKLAWCENTKTITNANHIFVSQFDADRTLFQSHWSRYVCLFVWTVCNGTQFERKEDSDEPVHYGRRKSLQIYCLRQSLYASVLGQKVTICEFEVIKLTGETLMNAHNVGTLEFRYSVY